MSPPNQALRYGSMKHRHDRHISIMRWITSTGKSHGTRWRTELVIWQGLTGYCNAKRATTVLDRLICMLLCRIDRQTNLCTTVQRMLQCLGCYLMTLNLLNVVSSHRSYLGLKDIGDWLWCPFLDTPYVVGPAQYRRSTLRFATPIPGPRSSDVRWPVYEQ